MAPLWRLAVGWLTLFVVGTDLFILSPLLPPIAGEFGMPAGRAGLAVTFFSVSYMVAAPAFGMLADRIGRRRTLIWSLLCFALANLMTAAAGGFGAMLLARTLAGISAAGVSPLIYAGVGEAARPERRARWMALAVSGLLLGLSLGTPVSALIGEAWGWRAPFLVIGGASLLLVAGTRAVWSADQGAAARAALGRIGIAELAGRLMPTVLWATALYGVYTYLGVGLTAAGFSPPELARAIALYGIGALCGTLLGGQAADRLGPRRTMLASLVGLAACLFALGLNLHAEWTADAVLLITSALAQLFFPAQQSSLARDFPSARATVLAWNNSALFLGICLGSVIGGEAVVRVGFAANSAICAVIACIAIALGSVAVPEADRTEPLKKATGLRPV